MKPFSIMLLAGALFLAIAVFTSHWLGFGEGHGGLFSTSFCRGDDDCETELMIKFIGRGGGGMLTIGILVGILTVLAGMASAVLAAISGFMTMSGKRGASFVVVILTGVTAFLGVVFLGTMHGTSPGNWGFSTFLFFIGSGLAIGGAVMAMKAFPAAMRPMMMMHGMAPMGMMPPMGMQPGMPQGYGQPQQMQQGYGQPPYAQAPQAYGQPPQMQQPPMQQMQPQQMQPQQPPMQPTCDQCGGQTQWIAQYGKLFCGRCNRYLV